MTHTRVPYHQQFAGQGNPLVYERFSFIDCDDGMTELDDLRRTQSEPAITTHGDSVQPVGRTRLGQEDGPTQATPPGGRQPAGFPSSPLSTCEEASESSASPCFGASPAPFEVASPDAFAPAGFPSTPLSPQEQEVGDSSASPFFGGSPTPFNVNGQTWWEGSSGCGSTAGSNIPTPLGTLAGSNLVWPVFVGRYYLASDGCQDSGSISSAACSYSAPAAADGNCGGVGFCGESWVSPTLAAYRETSAVEPLVTASRSSEAVAMRTQQARAEPADVGQAPAAASQARGSKPQSLEFARGGLEITWTVDGRKLRSTDGSAVSPSFHVSGQLQHVFKFMLVPAVNPTQKGQGRLGANFRRAKGRARVELKCEGPLLGAPGTTSSLSFRISVGSPGVPWETRGPATHDFGRCPIGRLGEWDLNGFVDGASQTFNIRLEVLPPDHF